MKVLGKGNLHPISESGTQSLYTFLKAIKIDGSGNQLEYTMYNALEEYATVPLYASDKG